ncbi:MAG TPA: hypothetical protein DCM70_09080 [Rhodobacteraceae bacterium]|nr:hypothetical protein [Paracoccaceae bacterium]
MEPRRFFCDDLFAAQGGFKTKQWLIWNRSLWSADKCGLINKLAYHTIIEAKQAPFDTVNLRAA